MSPEVDVFAAVHWISHRRLPLLAAAIVGGAIAFVLSGLSPIAYRAAATLAISPASSNPVPLHTRIENTALAEKIIRRFDLTDRIPGMSAATLLADHVRIEDVWGRDLLRVHVTLPDARLAADVANAFAESVVGAALGPNSAPDLLASGPLKRQRDYALERLRQAEAGLRSVAAVPVRTGEEEALRLAIEIEAEEAGIAKAELELRKQPAGASRAWSPRRAMLNEEIARRRTRLNALQRERESRKDAPTSAPTEGESQESSPPPTVASAQADYEVARQVYVAVATRYEDAVVRQITDQVRLELLERASVPDRPVSRLRGASTALGVIAGLLLSCGVLAARDLVRPRTPEPR
jgi:hypothetical protein